jgi:hypothetical protein
MNCARSNSFRVTRASRKRNFRRTHFEPGEYRGVCLESSGVEFRFSGECARASAHAARMSFKATPNFTAGKDRQLQSALKDRETSAAEILRWSERHFRVTAVMHDSMRSAVLKLETSRVSITQRSEAFPAPSSTDKSAKSCPRAPVSVGLRTIETGDNILAQRQSPRASRRLCVDAKVPKSASTAATSRTMSPPASDPRSMQRRSSRGVM